MRAFRKPKRFFVIETFFVGQPVAGFFVYQADADLAVGYTDKVNQIILKSYAGKNFVTFLLDDVQSGVAVGTRRLRGCSRGRQ